MSNTGLNSNFINFFQILGELESFYLSSQQSANIKVNLGNPINKSIYLLTEKQPSYTITVFKFLTRLNLVLNNIGYIQPTNNPGARIYFNGIKSRQKAKDLLDELKLIEYKAYVDVNNTTYL